MTGIIYIQMKLHDNIIVQNCIVLINYISNIIITLLLLL